MPSLEDYIAQAQGLGIGELLRQRLERTVLVASPAAGTDWTQAVPAGVAWEVLSIRALFTTSAVVAARSPELTITDGVSTFAMQAANNTQAASVTVRTGWARGTMSQVGSGASRGNVATLPEVLIPSGGTISSFTVLMDAGDQWSAIALRVREWSVAAVQAASEYLCKQLR